MTDQKRQNHFLCFKTDLKKLIRKSGDVYVPFEISKAAFNLRNFSFI
jgi:hypothetical protein